MQLRSYCIYRRACSSGNERTKALCVLDDYQQNPDGLAEGDVIKVVGAGLKFFHIMKFKVTNWFLPSLQSCFFFESVVCSMIQQTVQ